MKSEILGMSLVGLIILGCSDERVQRGPREEPAASPKAGIHIVVNTTTGPQRLTIPPVRSLADEDLASAQQNAQSIGDSGSKGAGGLRPQNVVEVDGDKVNLADFPGRDQGWLLAWGAAMQCASELPEEFRNNAPLLQPLAESYAAPASPLVSNVWEGWPGGDGRTNWYVFNSRAAGPYKFNSCEMVLTAQELTLCIADKLEQVASTLSPLEWTGPADGAIGGSVSALEDTWTIPVQSEKDKFVARDLAINALAHVARLEFMSAPGTGLGTCSDAYAAVLSTPNHSELADIFGSAIGQPALYPPGLAVNSTNSVALARARLNYKTHILTAASRLLKGVIEESVYADLAGAEHARSAAGDWHQGFKDSWGVDVGAAEPYNTLQHAARVLLDRWEMGTLSFPDATVHSPTVTSRCGGSAPYAVRRLSGYARGIPTATLLDGAVDARWQQPPVRSGREAQVVRILSQAGIAIPAGDDPEQIDDVREAVRAQLLLSAAIARGLTSADDLVEEGGVAFRETSAGQAAQGVLDEFSDEELAFAVNHTYETVRMIGGLQGWTVGVPANGAGPVSSSVPDVGFSGLRLLTEGTMSEPGGLSEEISALGGAVVKGGIPAADLTHDITGWVGRAFAAPQCFEPDSLAPKKNSDPAVISQLSERVGTVESFQSSFAIADVFRRRLGAIRDLAIAAGDTSGFGVAATSASAEVRAWAGPGRIVVRTNTDSTENNLDSLRVYIEGLN